MRLTADPALRSHARRALIAVVSVAVLLAAPSCAGGSEVDRDQYVGANRAIFDELPQYPGAAVVDEVSTPYRMYENTPVIGWGTRFGLSLAAGTTAPEVATFYEAALDPEWQLIERLDGPVFNYRHDGATLSVNLENSRIAELELFVDHAYYENIHW